MDEALLLFTSNMRPLYEQDALDVLAAPDSYRYRFRYEHKYVDPELHGRWNSDDLRGLDVLVVFSIQQQANYHQAAYIPVRRGTVTGARVEGTIHTIEFALGDYALPASEDVRPWGHGQAGADRAAPTRAIQKFSEALRKLDQEDHSKCPDGKVSASVIPEDRMRALVVAGKDTGDWQVVARLLANTLSFREALFARTVGIESATSSKDVQSEDGAFVVYEGRSYRLSMAYWQPTFRPRTYGIWIDDAIGEVVGQPRFPVSSRYDTRLLTFHVFAGTEGRSGSVLVQPDDDSRGASIEIPVNVKKPIGRKVGAPVATMLALGFIALPGILTQGVASWVKVLALTGIAVGVLARYFSAYLA